MLKVNCIQCGGEFETYPSRLKVGKSKFCSTRCHGDFLVGKSFYPQNEFKKGFRQKAGDQNPNWKGKDAGIEAIHKWIYRNWGQPNECEQCGTKKAKRFDWASKNGKYTRERKDWLRLCRSCHVKMDKNWLKKEKTIYGR